MENTLLAANENGRIYKTADGKFWCEEISRCALCDSEEEAGMFFGATYSEEPTPELRAFLEAAGVSPERAAAYEYKHEARWHAEYLRGKMEKHTA